LQIPGYSSLRPFASTAAIDVWAGTRASDGAPVLVKVARTPAPTVDAHLRNDFEVGRQLTGAHFPEYLQLLEHAGGVAVVQRSTGGTPLAPLIPRDGFAGERALDIAIQLAESLFALHSAGLVLHGLCPALVLYDTATGKARLLDLGSASRLGGAAPEGAAAPLGYISPEQTGRIGRAVDQRSDLYTLGATLFHLLCGRPPFKAADDLAMVHAQLARTPPDPREARPGLPDVIAEIVLRLLAKQPEERYQTVCGTLADLRECAAQLREHGRIQPFALGRKDLNVQLRLPERLYGRSAQVALLEAALDRVSTGATELTLVGGYSGSGKSTLVAELRAPVGRCGGFFLTGKFEQLGEPAPFAPIREAFAAFFESLAANEPQRIAQWRAELEAALAQQGRVLVDFTPEAALLLGEQPPVETLGPVEAQYRFTRVFQQFLRVLASPGQPLVLVLDDCQWADSASLRLIEDILGSPDLGSVLVVAAYRDNEVGPAHALTAFLDRLRQKKVAISQVTVPPLREEDVTQLVADALERPREEVAAIARELHQRVEGNPFYLRAFLGDLCDSRTLSRDASGAWQWDMARLARTAPPESVVRLVGSRLARLPGPTRELLQVAACLGSTFSREMLGLACGVGQEQIASALAPAIVAGVVVESAGRLRFLHDRVQEASYDLIAKGDEATMELSIGRRRAAALDRADGDVYLAQAVQHLNAGRVAISDPGERRQLAGLNLRAAVLARRSTAYASAARHAAIGIELLGEAGWHSDYAATFELHALGAECEYLCGNFDSAESLYPRLLAHARSDLDRIRALNIRKDQYELQGRYLDAIAVLKEGLAVVGIRFPESEAGLREALQQELAEMPAHLRGRSIAQLVDAPPLEDPLEVATLRMLMGMWPSCYVAGLQDLLGLVSVKVANFSLRHGNCEVTSAAYVNYSFVAGMLSGDYQQAYEFGQVGIALAERYPDKSVRSWCHFLFGCGTLIWRRPLREGLPHLERSVEDGIASGNIASASYAASYIVTDSFMRGMRVEEARELYERHFPFLERSNPAIHMFGQLGTTALREVSGIEGFDEAAFLATYGRAEFFQAVYLFGKVCACYLGDRIDEGATHVDKALDLVPRLVAGTFKVPETLYYAALTLARLADRRTGIERESLVARIADLAARLRALAASCPQNIAHKARLVEAELARLGAPSGDPVAAYEEAADAAAQAGFMQDEALAYELCGRYLDGRGLRRLATASLRDALKAWEAWGAPTRVRLLEREFSGRLQLPPAEVPIAATARGAPLDWLSVTKASQAISREIDFDRLVERLVQIVGENAGARRAVLFLPEADQLVAIAEANLSGEPSIRRPRTPLAAMDVPAAIVEDVRRRGQAIVLADAAREGEYKDDLLVAGRGLRSILCMPVRHQAALRGVLYLENDLGSGIFTAERCELLELLLAQVAISLENARLYTVLERQNERLRLLWEAAGVLLTTDAPDAMLQRLFSSIRHSLGLDAYINFTMAETPGTLRLASYAGLDEAAAASIERLEFGQAICGKAALTRRPIAATDIQRSDDPSVSAVRAWGIRAYACYPLLAGERLLGTLSFASRSRDAFASHELEFLETISQYVTVAYEKLGLIEGMREQDRRKDEFLATLSHELRNPLAPIRNGLQLFRMASGNASIVETARAMMERQVEHMVRLVDDLLDMSRISRNKLELRKELADLASIVRTAVETSRPLIDASGHVLELELPSSPVILDADPVRLAQVFANLLNNAAKYTPRGGLLHLRVERANDSVIVAVRDNGVGIAPTQLARIFDMFVQLERPAESAAGGLGIGLTLVKRLVEMHGGTIEARSSGANRGSEFVVRLPALVLPEGRDPGREERRQGRPAQRLRILIADDNRDAAESLALMLECLGHEVFTVHDGAAAVETAASTAPDIALLDVGMPVIDGLEAGRRIRANAKGRKLLLVAITGWGQEEDRRRSSAAGFDDHLVKPVDPAVLEAVLERARPGAGHAAAHPAAAV